MLIQIDNELWLDPEKILAITKNTEGKTQFAFHSSVQGFAITDKTIGEVISIIKGAQK